MSVQTPFLNTRMQIIQTRKEFCRSPTEDETGLVVLVADCSYTQTSAHVTINICQSEPRPPVDNLKSLPVQVEPRLLLGLSPQEAEKRGGEVHVLIVVDCAGGMKKHLASGARPSRLENRGSNMEIPHHGACW